MIQWVKVSLILEDYKVDDDICPGVKLFIQSNKNRSYFARYREAQMSECQ